ncbi:MAG: DUF87 domain-containing protein [Desulfurococcaceae archaeon]
MVEMGISALNLIKVLASSLCNLLLVLLLTVQGPAEATFSASLGIITPWLDIIVSAVHIAVSFILLNNALSALLNRTFFIVYLVSMGYEHVNNALLFREMAGLMLSLPLIVIVKHVTGLPSTALEFKRLVKSRVGFKVGANELFVLLISHIGGVISVLATSSSAYSTDIYVIVVNNALVPVILLFMVMLVSEELSGTADRAIMGFTSGLGVLGLAPLISLMAMERTSGALYPSRALYASKRGLYLGKAVATLTYGYPSNAYRKLRKSARFSGEGRRAWYWRAVQHSLYVDLNELNTPHIIVIGSSGSGKTTLVKHIVLESSRVYGHNVLIIDQHGEYKDLASFIKCKIIDASRCSLNPLVLANTSPRERALQLAHAVSVTFRLGLLQRKMLEEVIMKTYELKGITSGDPATWRRDPPTLQDLVGVCKELGKEIPEYNRLLPYIVLLSEHISGGEWLSVEELLLESAIIDMTGLSSDFARALFLDTLMYTLINKMYTTRLTKKVMLVIEEARGLLPRSLARELLSRLFAESRKFGFSIVVVSQEIRRIPKVLVDNAGLRVFFVLNEPRSVEEASKIIAGLDVKEKSLVVAEAIRTLAPHTFMIHATGVDAIFVVKSPFLTRSKSA